MLPMADPRAGPLLGFVRGPKILSTQLLPHDALHQCGLCRGNMSVCLSVCPSVTRQYSVETAKHIITIFSPFGSHPFCFFVPNGVAILRRGRLTGRRQQGVWKNRDFRLLSRSVSEIIQGTAIVTMKCEYEAARNQAFEWYHFNDLAWPLTQISRSRHNLTLNISETVRDT